MQDETKLGIIVAAAGVAGVIAAEYQPDKPGLRLGGYALLGVGVVLAIKGSLEDVALGGGVLPVLGDALVGTPGPSDARKVRPYKADGRPAKFTNLQKLSGRILNPPQGGMVSRNHFFGSVYPIRFDLSNWGPDARRVDVKLALAETNAFGKNDSVLDLGSYDLPADGGSVLVEAEAQVESFSGLGLKLTARLYGNGFLLAKTDFGVI